MYASRALVATAFVVILASAFPAHASQRATTDIAGTSHAMPMNGRQALGRQSRLRSGWIGVGINTAILVVKIAIPSIARHPLARS